MDELQIVFTIIAVFISFWSVYTVRRLWYQANRPIVSAVIKENSSGEGIVFFDLVVINSGNRPATKIHINARRDDIDSIIIDSATHEKRKEIYSIFSKSSRIQLLLNGKETRTFFYGYQVNPDNQICILKYEAGLPIEIEYQDIEGNKYVSQMSLYTRDSEGFGGSSWRDGT